MKKTKNEIVKQAAIKCGVPNYIAKRVVSEFVAQLATEILISGNEVTLSGLGKFFPRNEINDIQFVPSRNLEKIYEDERGK